MIQLTLRRADFHLKLMTCIYGYSKFLLRWKMVGTDKRSSTACKKKGLQSKNYEAVLLLGSPGEPLASGWQMINIYVTIHSSIHQSITTTLPCKRVGAKKMMRKKRESQGLLRKKERNGLLSF